MCMHCFGIKLRTAQDSSYRSSTCSHCSYNYACTDLACNNWPRREEDYTEVYVMHNNMDVYHKYSGHSLNRTLANVNGHAL